MFILVRSAALLALGVALVAAAVVYGSVILGAAGALALAVCAWMLWRARARRAAGARARARPDEKLIYEKLWSMQDYRKVAPGEQVVETFVQVAAPAAGARIVDLGCGSGRASLKLASSCRMDVTMVDFAGNCLDDEVAAALAAGAHALRFVEADLTKPLPVTAQFGFCTDVMEHIPEDKVDDVLDNCLAAAEHVFFQICTVEDGFGKAIGHPLHLTVRPHEWWREQLERRGCVIHWSEKQGVNALFYVSSQPQSG
jgi:SAM-dependent methyltransferase